MQKIGEMDHPDLPPALFIENGEILGPVRIYKKDNLYVILSDFPFEIDIAYVFSESVIEFAKKNKIDRAIMVSGLEPSSAEPQKPKVYGLGTNQSLESLMYQNDIPKFLSGFIFGTDAAVISAFRASKIPALVLFAECHPFFPDPQAAVRVITTLSKVLKVQIDTTDIQKRLEFLRIQHRNLMQETINALSQQQEKKPERRIPQFYR